MPNEWDEIASGLAGLRAHDADPERVERIRRLCLAALATERSRRERRGRRVFGRRGWLEPALAFGLSALYLAAALSQSFALMR
jgi:hypothetical protein